MLAACNITLSTIEPGMSDGESRRYAQSGDLRAEVDALVQPLIDRGAMPGAIVGVLLPDGRTQFFGYGVSERGRADKPDGDTLFAIGSLSKGFLGAIAATMVQDGQLSWDDTLEKLLPGVPLSEDAKKITVGALATHTSGLPRQPFTLDVLRQFIRYFFTGESFYDDFTQSYVVDYLATFDSPSREPRYSNIGYGLLAYLLERRSGQSLDALLAQRITGPLGLKNTGYEREKLPGYAKRAHGYAGDQPKFIVRGQPVPDWQFTEFMKGSAAMYSDARDLLIFAAAHLTGGHTPLDIALADTLQERFPQPRRGAAIAWIVDHFDDQNIVYQVGNVAGYSTYIGLDPAHRTAVVVLRNAFNWDASIGHELLALLAHAEDLRHPRPPP
jgi:CubicO group peptidase (beta-lactamase class C family)